MSLFQSRSSTQTTIPETSNPQQCICVLEAENTNGKQETYILSNLHEVSIHSGEAIDAAPENLPSAHEGNVKEKFLDMDSNYTGS